MKLKELKKVVTAPAKKLRKPCQRGRHRAKHRLGSPHTEAQDRCPELPAPPTQGTLHPSQLTHSGAPVLRHEEAVLRPRAACSLISMCRFLAGQGTACLSG